MSFLTLMNKFGETQDPEVQKLMQKFAALHAENRHLTLKNELLADETARMETLEQKKRRLNAQLEQDEGFSLELAEQETQLQESWYELKGKLENFELGRRVPLSSIAREDVLFQEMQLLSERLEQERNSSNEMENRQIVKELLTAQKELAMAEAELDSMKRAAAAKKKVLMDKLDTLKGRRNTRIVELIQGGKELKALRNELANISQQAAPGSQANKPLQNTQESAKIVSTLAECTQSSIKKSSWLEDEEFQRVRIPVSSHKNIFKFPTFRTFFADSAEHLPKMDDAQRPQKEQSSSDEMYSREYKRHKQTESQQMSNEDKLLTEDNFVVPSSTGIQNKKKASQELEKQPQADSHTARAATPAPKLLAVRAGAAPPDNLEDGNSSPQLNFPQNENSDDILEEPPEPWDGFLGGSLASSGERQDEFMLSDLEASQSLATDISFSFIDNLDKGDTSANNDSEAKGPASQGNKVPVGKNEKTSDLNFDSDGDSFMNAFDRGTSDFTFSF